MITILDQYNVEPITAYSGSYTDLVFSGSMLDNNRRVIASHTSGSNELRIFNKFSDNLSFSGSNRHRSLGMSLRFRHFICEEERYEDTILPDVFEAYTLNGGFPVTAEVEFDTYALLQEDNNALRPTGKLIYTTFGSTALHNPSSDNVADEVWFSTYPFQQRYKGISRKPQFNLFRSNVLCPYEETQTVGFETTYGDNLASDLHNEIGTVELIMPRIAALGPPGALSGLGATAQVRYTLLDVSGSVTSSETFLGILGNLYPPGGPGVFDIPKGTVRPTQKQLARFLFGIGDAYQNTPSFSAVSSSFLMNADGAVNTFYPSSIDIRGWKYGVFNAFPQNSTCIFQSNRYGQFRDMLEQRKNTKFFNVDGLTVNGKNNGKKGSLGSVVNVRFLSGSASAVSASNPSVHNRNDSGIFDNEYRSGQPFSDI